MFAPELGNFPHFHLTDMSSYRTFFNKFFVSILLVFFVGSTAFAQDGEALFKANCASCHKVDADLAGPALKGWRDRAPEGDWIYKWVKNPSAMIATDAYAKSMFEKWKPTVMTAFSHLTNEEIDAIMKYVDDYVPPVAATPVAGAGAGAEEGSDNTLLYGILTLVLALVSFILLQINSNLR